MGKETAISWTDHTFNIAWGCEKISPGCTHCYADAFSHRVGLDVWGPGKDRRTFGEKHWSQPLAWDREARKEGRSHRVFCSSMTDWALDDPTLAAERPKLWALIRKTPHLDWQLLTKRANRIVECLPDDWGSGYPNVWLGVSVEDRKHGFPRMDHLRKIPAVVRFLSVEPLLEDLGPMDLTGIDWAITGGESGHHFRTMDPSWAIRVRDQCKKAGTTFYHKQGSGLYPGTGVQLDGVVYHDFPTPRTTAATAPAGRLF
jgi:protein gp37